MNDDDNWEAYVPQVGERYAEGGQTRYLNGGQWFRQPAGEVHCPSNESYEYRRPKQKVEEPVSEPAAQPTEYESRVTQMTVVRTGYPIYADSATTITINDESGREFVEINQRVCKVTMRIYCEEWPALREAIDTMIQNCRAEQ
jgi:hypothetical protein